MPSVQPDVWNCLTDDQQLHITRAALDFAIHTIAGQADLLAGEMESGSLLDRGGPDALRLLAIALRASSEDTAPHVAQPPDLAMLAMAGTA